LYLCLLIALIVCFIESSDAKPKGHFYGAGGGVFPIDKQKGAATSGMFYRMGIGIEYLAPNMRNGFEILAIASHISAPKSFALYRSDNSYNFSGFVENEEFNLTMFGGGAKFNVHRLTKRQILSLHLATGLALPDRLAKSWFETGFGIAFGRTLHIGVSYLFIDGVEFPVYMIPVTVGLRL
jgi:hypothetical protein